MKEGWVYKRLLDECSILYGYPFDSKCFSTSIEDMPLIRIRDVKEGKTTTFYKGEYPKEYVIHKGDYLIGMDGEFNISPWQSEDALLNQRVCMISCKTSSLLMRFVYRFLIKELKKIEDETPFVTVKHLSAKKLNQIEIPVPPLSEQQRIVSELDLLSSIIEKKKAQLKEYDQLAQSIFYDMFGDPVSNEKGWEVKKLGEIGTIGTGATPNRKKEDLYYGGDINWVKTTEVHNCEIINTEETITQLAIEETNCKIYPPNTLLMAMYGQGKTSGQIAKLKIRAATNQACAAIMLDEKVSNLDFIYTLLLIKYEDIRAMAQGGNQANLNMKLVGSIPIIIPSLELQIQFASKIEAIERQKALIQQSITETETLFDSRMDFWFS